MNLALTQPQAKVLIGTLEGLRKRPQMYVGKKDKPEDILLFLSGIQLFCTNLADFDRSVLIEVAQARGWQDSPLGILPSLQASELSEAEISTELINIYIETYKLLYHL